MNPLLWVTGSVSLSFDISGCHFRDIYVFYNAHQENKIKPKYLLTCCYNVFTFKLLIIGVFTSQSHGLPEACPPVRSTTLPVTSMQRPLCHCGSAPTVPPWHWKVWNAYSSCRATTHKCESGHRWNQARHSSSTEGPCWGPLLCPVLGVVGDT